MPSRLALPPEPPVIGFIAAMIRRPDLMSVVFTFIIGPPLAGAPIKRSGTACANAPKVRPCSRLQDRVLIPTAAGKTGFTIVPDGRMHRQARAMPEFK